MELFDIVMYAVPVVICSIALLLYSYSISRERAADEMQDCAEEGGIYRCHQVSRETYERHDIGDTYLRGIVVEGVFDYDREDETEVYILVTRADNNAESS